MLLNGDRALATAALAGRAGVSLPGRRTGRGAAAALAAARTAARLMAAETERTARRVRALRRRWIPRLSAELVAVDQTLEQTEHEDAVRRRWAAGQDRQGRGR